MITGPACNASESIKLKEIYHHSWLWIIWFKI